MPAILAALATWIGNTVFTALYWFTVRKGYVIAVMLGIVALLGVAINALLSEIDSLIASIAPTPYSFVVVFLPDNTSICLAAIISTHLACIGYKLTMKFIDYKSRILLA